MNRKNKDRGRFRLIHPSDVGFDVKVLEARIKKLRDEDRLGFLEWKDKIGGDVEFMGDDTDIKKQQ